MTKENNKKIETIKKMREFYTCKYCNRSYISEEFLRKHIIKRCFYTIDLHNMKLKESKKAIEEKIRESIMLGKSKLNIIHGYRGGTILRDYLQSKEFYIDMKAKGFIVKGVEIRNLGSTIFSISKITDK